MNYKTIKFDLQESNADEGLFFGYGGTVKRDSDGDIIERGAYAKTISETQEGFPLLWMHRPDQPIGLIKELVEDDNGLLIRGQLDLDVEKGREVFSGMKKGYIDRFSVGFQPIKHAMKGNTRHITEVKLYEISAITKHFSANDAALLLGVKSLKEQLEILQNLSTDEVSEDEVASTITHLKTLMEPTEVTPEHQPSEDTEALLKRLKAVWGRQ